MSTNHAGMLALRGGFTPIAGCHGLQNGINCGFTNMPA
jgi:hypothetical protein